MESKYGLEDAVLMELDDDVRFLFDEDDQSKLPMRTGTAAARQSSKADPAPLVHNAPGSSLDNTTEFDEGSAFDLLLEGMDFQGNDHFASMAQTVPVSPAHLDSHQQHVTTPAGDADGWSGSAHMSSVARAAGSSGPSPSWIKQTSSPTSLSTDPHDVTQHLSQTASDIKTAPGNAYSRNSILARDMPSMVYTKNGQASTPAPGGQNPPSYGMSPLLRQGSKNFHYTASDSPLSASTAVGSGNMRQQAAYARSLSAEGGAETNVQHRADTASSLHGDNTSSLYAASTAAKTQATLATDAQEAVPRRPPNTAVLSRHSIMTQAKNRPGRFQHSAVSKNSGNQLFSRAADQTDAHKTHSASLQSGSSKKRKALGEETPESVDDLSTYYNSPAFYYDAERRHAANLGSSTTAAGLQSKQLMSAAQHQASFAPNYSAIAHSWTQNADGFISSSPRVKRRKLMRASSSWGSSDSVAATLDPTLGPSATHGPPTAGFAQDSIWRPTSPLFANSVLHPTGHPTSAAAHPGTDPRTPFHAPAGVTTTPHAHHAANPSAAPEAPAVNAVPGLLHAPGLPQGVHREPHQVPGPARGSNSTCPAAPQDASHQTKYIAPPQAASHDPLVALSQAAASTEPRVHPQAYPLARTHAPSQGPAAALVKRAGYQEGQLVWGKCRGHPWWPATVRVPDGNEKNKTKWRRKDVFVVYFGTGEIEALDQKNVRRWKCKVAPAYAEAELENALHQAQQAVNEGALV